MPYIKQADRPRVLETLKAETEGELNFLITSIVKEYMNRKGLRYVTINEVLGVLDAVTREFYRRIAAPYEDKKIQENGDVY